MANEPLVFPDLNLLAEEIRAAAPGLAQQATEIIKRHAPEYHGPDPTHAHVLKESLEPKTEDLPDGAKISVVATGAGASVAQFLLHGTSAHYIPREAKTSGALRFWLEGDVLVFAKQVFVSGIEPDNFVSPAVDEIHAAFEGTVFSTLVRFSNERIAPSAGGI